MSLLARLSRLLYPPSPTPSADTARPALHVATSPPDLSDVPKYPPYNPGLPAVAPERIVATQSELIARLRSATSVSDADFERTYLAAITAYAAFVHLLPASESHHHRGTGGLFRHGLEAGLYGAMHAERLLFVMDEPPIRRRVLEPIWRFAAFLAALNHDIGKPLSDVGVMDLSGEHAWNPFACNLYQWAQQRGISHYVIRFRPGRHQDHEMIGVLALEQVVSSGVKQYLAEAGPKLLSWMVSAIANAQGAEAINPFRDLVIRADQDSVERDLRINGALQSNLPSVGVASERYVIDAMRRLLRGRDWKVNCKGARVWLIDGNLYVSWAAARDIVRLVSADKTPGVPRDPDSIADMLIERGLAVARESFHGARRYWWITPAILEGVTLKTVRITSPELLLDPAPASVAGAVLNSDGPEEHEPTEESASVNSAAAPTPPTPETGETQPAAITRPISAPDSPKSSSAPIGQAISGQQIGSSGSSSAAKQVSESVLLKPAATPPGKMRQATPPAPESMPAVQAPDPADQVSVPVVMPAEKPPTPAVAAVKQAANPFENKGVLSEIVGALLDEIGKGVRAADQVRRESGLVVMSYPDAFQGFGMEPRMAMRAFEGAGLIESDPAMATRLVRDGEDGRKVVVIRHREGMSLLEMIARTPRSQTPPPTPASTANPKVVLAPQAKDLVDEFIRYYQDPGVTAPFSLTRNEDTISLPLQLSAAHFARVTGCKQQELKSLLHEESGRDKPRLRIVSARNTQRVEIPAR